MNIWRLSAAALLPERISNSAAMFCTSNKLHARTQTDCIGAIPLEFLQELGYHVQSTLWNTTFSAMKNGHLHHRLPASLHTHAGSYEVLQAINLETAATGGFDQTIGDFTIKNGVSPWNKLALKIRRTVRLTWNHRMYVGNTYSLE